MLFGRAALFSGLYERLAESGAFSAGGSRVRTLRASASNLAWWVPCCTIARSSGAPERSRRNRRGRLISPVSSCRAAGARDEGKSCGHSAERDQLSLSVRLSGHRFATTPECANWIQHGDCWAMSLIKRTVASRQPLAAVDGLHRYVLPGSDPIAFSTRSGTERDWRKLTPLRHD